MHFQHFKLHEIQAQKYLTTHLDLVICMFSQHFYVLENFPYDATIKEWKQMSIWYGFDA